MATIANDTFLQVYVATEQDMTFAPAEGGYIDFGCSTPLGANPAARRIYETTSITIPSGSTVDMFASGGDATYSYPTVNTAPVASEDDAVAGEDNTKMMTALRVSQAIAAIGSFAVTTSASNAALAAEAAGDGLVNVPGMYQTTSEGDLFWCPSSTEYYLVAKGDSQPSFRGVFADWASLIAGVTDPVTGDQALVTSVVGLANVTAQYDGTYWRPTKDLYVNVADRVAGPGSGRDSEHYAATDGWEITLPAQFLRSCRMMEAQIVVKSEGNTDTVSGLYYRLGTSGTPTSNAIIGFVEATILANTDGGTSIAHRWKLSGSATTRAIAPIIGNGHWNGDNYGNADDTAATTSTGAAAVTLTATHDFDDALNLSVGLKMGGTTDTGSLSITWLFIF
jgi:hypothetical protein